MNLKMPLDPHGASYITPSLTCNVQKTAYPGTFPCLTETTWHGTGKLAQKRERDAHSLEVKELILEYDTDFLFQCISIRKRCPCFPSHSQISTVRRIIGNRL